MSWIPGAPVQIQLADVLLRSLTVDDVTETYLSWLRDPAVTRYQNVRFEQISERKLLEFVAGHDNDETFLLGIFDRHDGRHIGNHRAVCDLNHLRAQLGVMIGERSSWGSGIVSETRSAFLDFLFETRGIHKACGSVYADNSASIYNYQILGFEPEAVRVSHVVSGERRCDVIEFALFREDWRKRRGAVI